MKSSWLLQQRWSFLLHEIDHPEKCNLNDEFLAFPRGCNEDGIIVNRSGKCLDRFGDGTIGVPLHWKKEAETEEELRCKKTCDHTYVWREVLCDKDTNKFVSWVGEEYVKNRKNKSRVARGNTTLKKESFPGVPVETTLIEVITNIGHYVSSKGSSLGEVQKMIRKSAKLACSRLEKEWAGI